MTTVNSFPLETVAASTILPPVQWTYSSTITDADPGDGKFRLNNATPASATAAYIDNEEIGGTDVSGLLDTFDDSGNSTKRGTLTVYSSSKPTIFHIYSVSGSVTDGTGYRKLTIAHVTGAGTFTDDTAVTIVFTPHSVASETADTQENKTLTAPDINGGTADALTSLGIRSTGAAFDLKVASDEVLTADRRLNIDVGDADRNVTLGGDVSLSGDLTTSGAFSAVFTFTAATSVTFPTTGTLANTAYVDQITAANDAMVFKGVQDCSSNPNYPAADRGDTYRVSVAGRIGGASGIVVEAGDLFICITDGTAAGNQATVGTSWTVAQTNLDGAVIGPASAADGNFAQFDGTTGKLIKGGLSLGVDVQAFDADTLKADTADVLTAGFATTTFDAGTKSSGTYTPDEANGNFQKAVNGGAHTLAPPTNDCNMVIQYTNGASAGAITITGFTKATGDTPDTTSGNDFLFYITKINGFSHLNIVALQ